MADLHLYEDQAVLYLLDQLPLNERREFEARLAESSELRALLRELEEGTVALALTAPSQRPPAHVWKGIARTVAADRNPETVTPSFWVGWWRYGWAVAAICVAGWLLHVYRLGRSANPAHHAERVIVQPALPEPSTGVAGVQSNLPPTPKNAAPKMPDIAAMRRHIAELSNQISQVSQSLLQQQTLLLETDRFKVFQLSSTADGNPATNTVSPALQRALFLAMARELGWVPDSQTAAGANIPAGQQNPVSAAGTNHLGIDFVDLRPSSNMFANPSPQPRNEVPSGNTAEANLASTASDNSVPGFMSGTNAVLAFDSSIVPPGTALEFWVGSNFGNRWVLPVGSTVVGNNAMIVTMPFTASSGNILTVTAGNGTGIPTIIGSFSPGLPSP